MYIARMLLLILIGLAASCAAHDRSADFEPLGPFLDSLMDETGVPGIQFAVFVSWVRLRSAHRNTCKRRRSADNWRDGMVCRIVPRT